MRSSGSAATRWDRATWAGQHDPAWLLARGERRAMNYGAYRAVCARINRRLGTNWTPHHLRHTARVRILDAGMALHEVQEIMGIGI